MRIQGDVRTYQASEWAAQRWDWFNRGKIVEPLSFCQFWRTVLIWATLRQLLAIIIYIPAKAGGRVALAAVVGSGEAMRRVRNRHEVVIKRVGTVAMVLYVTACALVIFTAITGSGLWTMIGMGIGFAVGTAIYGLFKIGALGLLWQAAVAAKHGICPPVKIEREEEVAR